MKLSLAECQSQYHQLNKARLKQETKLVNAVLQMQPISEYCLKGMVLLLAEQLITNRLGNNSWMKKGKDTHCTVQNTEKLHLRQLWVKMKHDPEKGYLLYSLSI